MDQNVFEMYENLNRRRSEITKIRRMMQQNFDFIVSSYGCGEFRDLKHFVEVAEKKNEKLAEALTLHSAGKNMTTLLNLETSAKAELAYLKKCLPYIDRGHAQHYASGIQFEKAKTHA